MTTRVRNIGGPNIPAVADAAERAAYVTTRDGFLIVQLDTNEIYMWDEGTTAWVLAGGSGGGDSFTIIQADSGTSPTADSSNDTLTFTTNDTGSYLFTGNSTTDTISLSIVDATASLRGLVSTGAQTIAGEKLFEDKVSIYESDTMSVSGAAIASKFAVHDDGGVTNAAIEAHKHSATAGAGAQIFGARSRGTGASPTVVQSGDVLLQLSAVGHDGTDYAASSQISFEVDGTPGSDDMPGRMLLKVSLDGTDTLVERFRVAKVITSSTAVIPSIVALSDGATISVDASLGNQFTVTLAGNRTLANPTNAANGQLLLFAIRQDATGSRTLTLDTKYRLGTDITSTTLTTTASKTDYLGVRYHSADDKFDVISFVRGY